MLRTLLTIYRGSPFEKMTFKVCNSVQHRTIQINHQPDATIFQFIFLTFIYSSTCFRRSPAHHQKLTTAVAASGITFLSWWWPCCVRGRAGRPDHDQQYCYHHAPTVKPEAAAAVLELLMMGGRTSETRW